MLIFFIEDELISIKVCIKKIVLECCHRCCIWRKWILVICKNQCIVLKNGINVLHFGVGRCFFK